MQLLLHIFQNFTNIVSSFLPLRDFANNKNLLAGSACQPPSVTAWSGSQEYFSDLKLPLSVQAHHIIQLSVRFWMQHIKITCYRIQKSRRKRSENPVRPVSHEHMQHANPNLP